MTRRYYRIRDLDTVEQRLIEGVPFVLTSYEHDGVRRRVAATVAQPDDLAKALDALGAHAREVPEGEELLADVYLLRAGDEDLSARVTEAELPEAVQRIAFVIAPEIDVRTFGRDGEEQADLRGMHPMLAARMDVWRLREFALERAPSAQDVYLFHATARENERDERLVALAEVRDLTPVRDESGASPRCPSSSAWCARRSRPCARSRPAGRRASACTGTACCSTPGPPSTSSRPRRARSSTASRA